MNTKTLHSIITISVCFVLAFSWVAFLPKGTALAEEDQINATTKIVYADQIATGWKNFSWGTVDFNNPSPVHSGSMSIKADLGNFTGIYLYYPDLFPDGFSSLKFYINGGTAGGQQLDVYLKFFDGANYIEGTKFRITAPSANQWSEVSVPFSSLGVSDLPITGIIIQNTIANVLPTFYVDDISFTATTNAGAPTISDSTVNPRAVIADNKTKVTVSAQIGDPQGLGDITEVYIDASKLGMNKIPLLDDGLNFDGAAGDGQYGAVFSLPTSIPTGEYQVILYAVDSANNVTILQAGALTVLVKPGGSPPAGLPARLGWGTNAWSGTAGSDWQGASGVPWDYNYTIITYDYFTSGLNPNYIHDFVTQAWGRGEVPVMVLYLMVGWAGCGESGSCYATALQDSAKVSTYLTDMEQALREVDGNKPVIIIIEPDLIGFMQQYTNGSSRPAGVQPDDPHSVPVALNKDGYEDSLSGFGQYIVHLVHTTTENALAAPMVSWWGAGDDPFGTVPEHVIQNAGRTAIFAAQMGGDAADLLAIDWDNRDAGSGQTEFWDPMNVDLPRASRANLWENALSANSGKRLLLWQVPAGNMNQNNTPQHYQDNRSAYAFSHPRDLVDTGVIGVLFGGGTNEMTQVWTDGDFIKDQGAIAYATPSVPSGFSLIETGAWYVKLRWDPNQEPDIWGYTLEYSPVGGGSPVQVNVGRSNSASLMIANAGDYAVKLRAYDAMGNASGFTSEINFTTTQDAPRVFLPIVVTKYSQ